MRIGEVSEKYDLSIDTLRYYDKIGLLIPSRIQNIRDYSKQDCENLKMILVLRSLQFSLDQIAEIIELDAYIDQSAQENNLDDLKLNQLLKILQTKNEQFNKKELEIFEAKKHLSHLIEKIYQLKKNRRKNP